MMTSEASVLAAIAVMAVATYAMRAGGFWLMQHVPVTPRLRRMLEALPGSVVVATVLPIAVREGPVAALAIAAAGAVMLVFRNDLVAVVTGMAVAAAARAMGM
jgi:branched chain amino acid efflux pump